MPGVLNDYQKAWLAPDVVAGVTLAAVAIPECMGYTKIVGTPVVTGLYTILLPITVFALLGSSRHLVVGADSATAAILFAGLIGLAHPYTPQWVALCAAAALLTAFLLLLASVLKLGFLSDFLSRTVLVGFLSGVGVSLLLGQLPEMLGLPLRGKGVLGHLAAIWRELPQTHLATLGMALGVMAVILLCEKFARRVPGSLLAVVLAIGATWMFGLERYGLAVVGRVQPGLPSLRLPPLSSSIASHLGATAASMFLVIVAQSAATARSFAQKYSEPLNENRDLFALSAANALAAVSGTFVVNGSPTKTAVVDAAGSRTQVAQLTTAGVTLAVLLFATSLIARLPNAALATIVFLIGIKLVDMRSLRQIWTFRKTTFAVALLTLSGVVFFGVEKGIFLAIALSLLDHLRQEYHPKDVLLVPHESGWKAEKAEAGHESAPGMLIYRFEAPLFFANADYFAARLQTLIERAPHPVKFLVIDMASMSDVDYTGGLMLLSTLTHWQKQGVAITCAQADDVRGSLDSLGITALVGSGNIFDSVQNAVNSFPKQTTTALPNSKEVDVE